MKINARDRKLVLVQKPPKAEAHNKNQKGPVRVMAEKYGINVETLRRRHLQEPDVPLEELAKRPLANRSATGRKGSKEWRKTNGTSQES